MAAAAAAPPPLQIPPPALLPTPLTPATRYLPPSIRRLADLSASPLSVRREQGRASASEMSPPIRREPGRASASEMSPSVRREPGRASASVCSGLSASKKSGRALSICGDLDASQDWSVCKKEAAASECDKKLYLPSILPQMWCPCARKRRSCTCRRGSATGVPCTETPHLGKYRGRGASTAAFLAQRHHIWGSIEAVALPRRRSLHRGTTSGEVSRPWRFHGGRYGFLSHSLAAASLHTDTTSGEASRPWRFHGGRYSFLSHSLAAASLHTDTTSGEVSRPWRFHGVKYAFRVQESKKAKEVSVCKNAGHASASENWVCDKETRATVNPPPSAKSLLLHRHGECLAVCTLLSLSGVHTAITPPPLLEMSTDGTRSTIIPPPSLEASGICAGIVSPQSLEMSTGRITSADGACSKCNLALQEGKKSRYDDFYAGPAFLNAPPPSALPIPFMSRIARLTLSYFLNYTAKWWGSFGTQVPGSQRMATIMGRRDVDYIKNRLDLALDLDGPWHLLVICILTLEQPIAS
ncbi:hypothetical protein U9M48_009196 [Paspalum notatum var. saurae]|uniref:Uncharacterized protein n=1 Tax=Paspalum notatum var. saurae TaxID=547442 RepID=A0AAQ3WEH1_PASNO